MRSHHHPLVLLLRLCVEDDRVDRVLLNAGSEMATVDHHRVEAGLVRTAGSLQTHLRGPAVEATQRTLVSMGCITNM